MLSTLGFEPTKTSFFLAPVKMKRKLLSFIFLWLCVMSYAQSNSSDDNPVIGYQYNLWGIHAQRLSGAETLEFSGKMFLDLRKEYKASFDKDEYWFLSRAIFTDNQVHKFQGYTRASIAVKHDKTKDYHFSVKLGPKWSQYYYDDILSNENHFIGKEIGCSNCNFSQELYLAKEDWLLTLYFEIRPFYKNPIEFKEIEEEEEIEVEEFPAIASIYQPIVGRAPIDQKKLAQTKMVFQSNKKLPKNETADQLENAPIPSIYVKDELSYHVLFKIRPTPYEEYSDLNHLGQLYRETYTDSGKTRYLLGDCKDLAAAKKLVTAMNNLGYKNLFIAEYRMGSLSKYVERWF
jgi:hypothetical protein